MGRGSTARVPLPGTSPTPLTPQRGPAARAPRPGGCSGRRGSFHSPSAAARVLRGREYPPVAPDAKEHMAEAPAGPGVLGAGTWRGGARGRRGTLGPAPGDERARTRAAGQELGTLLTGRLDTRERAHVGSGALPATRWRRWSRGEGAWRKPRVGGAEARGPPLSAAALTQCARSRRVERRS